MNTNTNLLADRAAAAHLAREERKQVKFFAAKLAANPGSAVFAAAIARHEAEMTRYEARVDMIDLALFA